MVFSCDISENYLFQILAVRFEGMLPALCAHECYTVEGMVDSPVTRNDAARGGCPSARLRRQGHATHRCNGDVVMGSATKELAALPSLRHPLGAQRPDIRAVAHRPSFLSRYRSLGPHHRISPTVASILVTVVMVVIPLFQDERSCSRISCKPICGSRRRKGLVKPRGTSPSSPAQLQPSSACRPALRDTEWDTRWAQRWSGEHSKSCCRLARRSGYRRRRRSDSGPVPAPPSLDGKTINRRGKGVR